MAHLLCFILAFFLPTFVRALPASIQPRSSAAVPLSDLAFFEQYAAAAYCSENTTPSSSNNVSCSAGNCPQVEATGAKTLVEFQNMGAADCTGFVAVDKSKSKIVVSFRGSSSVSSWLGNLKIKLVSFNQCQFCAVHAGFYESWVSVRSLIQSTLEKAVKDHPGYSIVVTGHSLGGALASIAAAELRTRKFQISLYTYGSPMPGNFFFVDFVTKQGNNFRITHKEDPVPKLPGYLLGYAHISPEYWITAPSRAPVTSAVVQVSSGAIQLISGNGGTLGMNVDDHFWYFNEISDCAPDELEIS